jgi:hypothetical protein
VHSDGQVPLDSALSAVSALEAAYERIVLALGLPAPLGDLGLGGSDALDLYLRDDPDADFMSSRDLPHPSSFDRAAAFCVARPADGRALERVAAFCVAEAVSWRMDAGMTPHLRRAYATELWWITASPTSADLAALDELSARPHAALGSRELGPTSEGAAVLFEYLESRLSRIGPGVASTALLAAAASSTAPNGWEWNNEPDVFDVLRRSQPSLADYPIFLGDLALARALLGDRDDGSHFPLLAWAGAFGRPRFDWVLEASSLPRRVALGPIEPTGVAQVWLNLDQWEEKNVLGLRAECEAPVAFKWQLIQLDPFGVELSRFHLPFQERATSIEQRVVTLGRARSILVVGTNVGAIGPAHPFDPDVYPYEPQACTIYLAKL